MSAFSPKTSPLIYPLLGLALVAVAVADFLTPLGIAVWIFYLIPLILTLRLWQPRLPLAVATMASVLLGLTLFTDEPGLDPRIASLNRTFGLITVWVVAGIASQFVRAKITVRKEQWLQLAQTQLSERMSGDLPLVTLGEQILRYLAEYVEAQAGAIFVEEQGAFRKISSYALPSDAKVPERFQLGDGLLGQAAKDRRTVILHDVPEGYLAIGSALGRKSPSHLAIAPAQADGAVNSVIELGFFERPDVPLPDLFARVQESIAIAVRSAKDRSRLQELLEETQQQAEELQTQSEELRVSNEELEEQGQALKESQARLEEQQAELEQTNAHLEAQTQLLESQKDELSRAKARLERQAREVEQASRYKSEFLANMSHELRTPLNSALILAKLLADNRPGNLNDEQVKYARTIQSAGNDLLALINDVLDLSKIEAGKMEVNIQAVRIHQLLDNLRATFAPLASQKGLRLELHSALNAPEWLESDGQRLEQILKNLLSNAIKFTEKGEVTLDVARWPSDQLAFTVRDTGIGIAEDQQKIIFEPFCQADGTTNRKYGGTGLGLSISRELTALLGGRIEVSSKPNQGSSFAVVLPVAFQSTPNRPPGAGFTAGAAVMPETTPYRPSPGRSESAAASPPPVTQSNVNDDRERLSKGRRMILVVEDDESFARIVYDLCHELGFDCLIAGRAEEALALVAQHQPSAVVLDLGLPDHSGLSVLDQLKSDARSRHIPVHVVSASDYAQTAFSLGAAGYMLKPVQRDELADALRRLESKLVQSLRRILVVEDDPIQLESVCQLLQSLRVETIGVRTANECLVRLKSETFDCMVLDLSLPDASGISLLETLSREDKYSFPPVIVYTGRALSSEEEQQLRRYSKSIIIKGAKSPERLIDEVTLFLHQVVAELPHEQQKMLQQARSRDAMLEARRILVVEDDVRNIFAITSVLEPHGVRILVARNGREAIETLERSQSGPAPIDLVLMDIMMPEMDGLTAMEEIRKRPEWKKLPMIALTAKAMRDDQEQCLAAGANDYMAKPLDVDQLVSLVRVWMPR